MVDQYLTEEEQLDRLKQWLKKYGWSIFWGIIIGLCLMYGWQYWSKYQQAQRQKASAAYQELMGTLQNKPEDFSNQAEALIKQYPKSPYATLSQLLIAQRAVNEQQWQKAIDHLSWIETHTKDKTFKEFALLRHARLLSLQKNYDQALTLLGKIDDPAFLSIAQEVKGDILFAQGQLPLARESYQQALAHAVDTVPAWQFVLQMKINSLPEPPQKEIEKSNKDVA